MNIEVVLVTDEKNGSAANVERKDVENDQKVLVDMEGKDQENCENSEKLEEDGTKMSENTAGINKRRHSETDDENISTIKKIKHNDKMEVADVNILEKESVSGAAEAIEATSKSDVKIDSTTESDPNAVASSSDDQDDLLDRLEAIDSSGLRPPDLKLEEIDTSDLEKDDLLKRLEEAEGGIESESVIIPKVEDQILINEDLLLEGETIPTENEELEQPSSTNTDSSLTIEKEEPVNVLTLEQAESNGSNDADSAVLVELDDVVSDSTNAKEQIMESHTPENTKSEIFAVDSTDEQISTKIIDDNSTENLDNADSTNEKLNNLPSDVPSTSTLSSTTSNSEDYSNDMTEIAVNSNKGHIPTKEITNYKPTEIETCVDSTNEQTNINNDGPVADHVSEHEDDSFAVDSTREVKNLAESIEIAVDSTNEEKKYGEDIVMKTPDSNIKPPDYSTLFEANKGVPENLEDCVKNEDAIISSGISLDEEKVPESPISLKGDVQNAPNKEHSEIKADDNIPLSLDKVENIPNCDPIVEEEVMGVYLEESSEAQPVVGDSLESNNPPQLEKELDIVPKEIIPHTAESIISENEVTPTTLLNSEKETKESSEAQPLFAEKITEIEMKESPISSVTSSSKEDSPTKFEFEVNSTKVDNKDATKDESTSCLPSTAIANAKPIGSNIIEEKVGGMEVDENLLADNEASDLCEQTTAIVMECGNDEEITSNVVENDVPIKSEGMLEDAARYSDSTASINSTSEEALINHNKETRIDEIEKCDGNLNISMDDDTKNPKTLNKEKLFGNVLRMNNGSSTPNSNNTSATTSNVFNSTPIHKAFEVSSENVSKISDNSKPCSSTPVIVLSDDTVVDTTEDEVTETETQCSSDGITNFAKSIIKLNGLSPSSSSQSEEINNDDDNVPKDSLNGLNLDLTNDTYEESLYEVGIWYEENEMKYLSVEKLDRNRKLGGRLISASTSEITGSESSDKRSSNGSVGSLAPFTLPQARLSTMSSNSSSSMSQKSIGKFAVPALPQRNKQTIKGISTLCNFMIDHFTKIKASLNQSHDNQDSLTYTPKGRGKEATKKSLVKEHDEFYEDKPQTSKGNKRKADTSNDSISSTDDEKTPKSKVSKKVAKTSNLSVSKQGHFLVPPSEVLDDAKIGLNVLARWIDKKYYAGKVVESKSGMKYVIKFEDGALKTLPQDLIVFGRDENILPLLGHEVHALVENDEYEVGYVQESEIENGVIYYKISIDTKTIRVTSSDIYLTDDQAKSIQDVFKNTSDLNNSDDKLNLTDGGDPKIGSAIKGRPHRNVVQKPEVIAATTPTGRGGRGKKSDKAANETEAGFSGGIATNKRGRKPKRPQPQSESSDVSDSLELDSAPNSPDSALEAINGVQPELQKTPKESQINKMCIMAEYLGTDKPDKNKNLEDLLGPIPNNKSLFRNKHFILTCTIAMKSPRPSSTKKCETPDDMKNKYRKFTSLPFIKEHLRKQIEEGGGKVYNHFEDIPKNKYKQCKLISPSPCVTAKYVQCLAAEIPAISHEWIIESCRNNSLVDTKTYALPSGWSLIEERYIKWAVGRNSYQRSTSNPLSNQIVLMASQNKDFAEFWTRVCKLAGSTIRVVKSAADITQGQAGCMLTDEEFPQDIKSKAEHFGIPIVSTVWVVQSLILGKVCKPDAHEKLTQIYQDDDY